MLQTLTNSQKGHNKNQNVDFITMLDFQCVAQLLLTLQYDTLQRSTAQKGMCNDDASTTNTYVQQHNTSYKFASVIVLHVG